MSWTTFHEAQAWGSGGDIVFASGSSPRLYRVSADGGAPVPLATQTGQGASGEALWPSFLPDGRTFLYWAPDRERRPRRLRRARSRLGLLPRRLLRGESNAAYDPAGFLLFTRGGVLLRQRFDAARLEVSGETTACGRGDRVESRLRDSGLFRVEYRRLGIPAGKRTRLTQFAWFDRNGRMLETVGEPGAYLYPSLSPDGTRLLYTDLRDGNLRILDLGRNIASRVTTGPGRSSHRCGRLTAKTIVYRGCVGQRCHRVFREECQRYRRSEVAPQR